ncbi:response regulator [Desulfatitalea alkaliphila]|uniref:Response regulator n=1 Tax=Desulfatitalea alkaliphila TaxID=2929485 RepID=A0AA41R0E0_9BACT|nr:response regulator [Desulfatitalea alkaliphila]MCJ8499879.1 response regulator [Desulfatitalea alkaliphila]
MIPSTTSVVADRNSYVRRLLQREMTRAGYIVLPADSVRQVLFWIERQANLALLVIDPDFPDTNPDTLLIRIRRQCPALPVIVHTHLEERTLPIMRQGLAKPIFIAKGGNSVEPLLSAVAAVLRPTGYEVASSRNRSTPLRSTLPPKVPADKHRRWDKEKN